MKGQIGRLAYAFFKSDNSVYDVQVIRLPGKAPHALFVYLGRYSMAFGLRKAGSR